MGDGGRSRATPAAAILSPLTGRPLPYPRWAELLATLLDDAIAIRYQAPFGLMLCRHVLPGWPVTPSPAGRGRALLLSRYDAAPHLVLLRMLFHKRSTPALAPSRSSETCFDLRQQVESQKSRAV
jgi:hypothetical protein